MQITESRIFQMEKDPGLWMCLDWWKNVKPVWTNLGDVEQEWSQERSWGLYAEILLWIFEERRVLWRHFEQSCEVAWFLFEKLALVEKSGPKQRGLSRRLVKNLSKRIRDARRQKSCPYCSRMLRNHSQEHLEHWVFRCRQEIKNPECFFPHLPNIHPQVVQTGMYKDLPCTWWSRFAKSHSGTDLQKETVEQNESQQIRAEKEWSKQWSWIPFIMAGLSPHHLIFACYFITRKLEKISPAKWPPPSKQTIRQWEKSSKNVNQRK